MINYKKKIMDLCEAYKHDPDITDRDYQVLESKLNTIPAYYNAIMTFNVQGPIYQAEYEGQEFRDKFQHLDEQRRRAHVAMTIAVNFLNRDCQRYGQEKMFDVRELNSDSKEDRAIAANICFEFCTSIFMNDRQRETLHIFEDVGTANQNIERRTLDEILADLQEECQTENRNTQAQEHETDAR